MPATCHVLSMYPPVGYPGITWWTGVVPEGTRVPVWVPDKLTDRVPRYPVMAALIVSHM